MEVILGIIGIAVGWWIITSLISAGARTAGAAVRTATGKGTFGENLDLAFKGMEAMEIRLGEGHLDSEGDEKGKVFTSVEVKGLFPLEGSGKLDGAFVTSILDMTADEGRGSPILCAVELFQEPNTIVYQCSKNIGAVGEGIGFPEWVRIAPIFTELLQAPLSGRRDLGVFVRLVDQDEIPEIYGGRYEEGDPKVLGEWTTSFSHEFSAKGYLEVAEDRDKARALSLKIGMAVAMADGSLDDAEGTVLKEWIMRMIGAFSAEKKERLKELYNNAMREAYTACEHGELSLSELTNKLNDIAEPSERYETIELCFDVMAADGVADPEEIRIIKNIAEELGLDFDEIEKIRDQKIIGLDAAVSHQGDVEQLLGIEKGLGAEEVKARLTSEFKKWNSRLNVLPEGEERKNAQRMLDLIAAARKKYG